MGGREIADLEAKLFDAEKKGCLAIMVGPRRRGEIDYELHHDGNARMKISLKAARLPEGTRTVTVFVNDNAVTDLEVKEGSGYLRLESARGDAIPEVHVEDTASIRAGEKTVCEGSFHRD